MATGVNAQRRLYAINNLDPLWYPADDEQRIGRGLRQGNMNPEIEIRDYSTKGTYDSQMWNLMEKKAVSSRASSAATHPCATWKTLANRRNTPRQKR